MAPLRFEIRPKLIGLGYLVSTEISLTAWLSFFLSKLAAVIGVSLGATPDSSHTVRSRASAHISCWLCC